jgi:RNA polymerase sigma-70 factor (ECF subfamily)
VVFLLAIIKAQIGRNEEDLRLLKRIMRGDQNAFSQFYDRYSSLLYTTVLRIVRSTEEAEDLLQEIFMQIWNKADLFSESKGSVYTWVVTIARRKAIDKLRSQHILHQGVSLDDERSLAVPDVTYKMNPLHATISAEYEAMMREALDTLTAEQRALIELSYYDGYTQAQISNRLELPLGTVKTRMRQGLMKLREFLKERLRERG